MRLVSQLGQLHQQFEQHHAVPAVRDVLDCLRSFREQLLFYLASPTPSLQEPSP
jgi:hypothetical protein